MPMCITGQRKAQTYPLQCLMITESKTSSFLNFTFRFWSSTIEEKVHLPIHIHTFIPVCTYIYVCLKYKIIYG